MEHLKTVLARATFFVIFIEIKYFRYDMDKYDESLSHTLIT